MSATTFTAGMWRGATVALVFACIASSANAQENEVPLGTPMPGQNVALVDQAGKTVTLGALKGTRATVVLFWGNKCPWTTKYEDRVAALMTELASGGTTFVLVNSNDGNSFPDENAAASAKYAERKRWSASYLTDAKSELAKLFGASRSPHVFVFDSNHTLVYVGAIDDSPGDPGSAKKQYLRDAVVAASAGTRVAVPQTKAFGCMIRTVQ